MDSHYSHRFTLDDGREVVISIYSGRIPGVGIGWPKYDVTIDGKRNNGRDGVRIYVPIPWNDQILEHKVRLEYEPNGASTIRNGKPVFL